MGSAGRLRDDYLASELSRLARVLKDTRQSRLLLSIAAVLDGIGRPMLRRSTASARRKVGSFALLPRARNTAVARKLRWPWPTFSTRTAFQAWHVPWEWCRNRTPAPLISAGVGS